MNDLRASNDLRNERKPRTSKPKVRTGCQTCKRRRVKCDESKPECNRCTNFGHKCEGYVSKEESPDKLETLIPIKRRLLSKATQETSPLLTKDLTSMILQSPILIESPQDENGSRYLRYFCENTASELAGGFDPALWNVLVLQACDNISVKQLTVALAALSIAMSSTAPNLWGCEKDNHHQYALRQYGLGLVGLQETVAGERDSFKLALISALLIFCFECLHGDRDRAMTQIRSATDLIVKRITASPHLYRFSRKAPLLPPHSEIDAELLFAFMRLDECSFRDTHGSEERTSAASSRIFDVLFSLKPLDIPDTFESIAEARVHLEDIKWRVSPSDQRLLDHGVSQEAEGDVFKFAQTVTASTVMQQCYVQSSCSLPNPKLSMRLAQWYDAFLPLLNHSTTPAGDSLFIAAATLQIQALATDILVSGVFSSPFSIPVSTSLTGRAPLSSSSQSSLASIESKDLFPTVRAILSVSRRLLAHPRFHKGFVFDVGIIPSLLNVVTFCPDENLRQEAIVVLEEMVPRREAVWDSSATSLHTSNAYQAFQSKNGPE